MGSALSRQTDNATHICRHGGIRAILEGMGANTDSVAVQVAGCRALVHLGMNSPGNKHIIFAAGGAEKVLAAMNAHTASAAVQVSSASALWLMATSSARGGSPTTSKAKIAALGGVEALNRALAAHAKSPDMQKAAETALRAIK